MSGQERRPLSAVYRQSDQVVASRLGEGGVLVHLKTNRIFELNETGIRIWELLGQGMPVADIVAALQQEFEVDEPSAHAETRALLDALEGEGLVDADRG
jgi:hypothetical protein